MNNTTEDKTVAIVSYIFFIGWIVAFVLHNNNKTELGAFHLRQTLGLYITWIILWWIPVIGWILNIIVFIFWLIGLINATQGEQKPIPIIGEFYQDLFKGIGK
ncbi:MAG: hypothetical protein K8R74_04360 [Bacteroidales bacterium]|nr:hypothetical protein [Bacteroidales bacterium]